MRRMISILCVCAMLFVFTGCGAVKTPDEAVTNFCGHMQTFNALGMLSCLEDGGEVLRQKLSDAVSGAETQTSDTESPESLLDMIPEDLLNQLKTLAEQMTFTVGEITVNGDHAQVTVNFSHADLSEAGGKTLADFFGQAIGMALSGADASDAEMMKAFLDTLTEKAAEAETGTTESTVVFPCVLTEKKGWKLEEIPQGAINVLASNLLWGFNSLADLLNGD